MNDRLNDRLKTLLKTWLPWIILAVGLGLRVLTALSTMDQVHPDEHFQTLEPAAKVVYGFGKLSWEWDMGLRSWFVPLLYVPLLWALKLAGIVGGPTPIYACRVFQALASGAMLWGFQVLLKRAGFRAGVQLAALALLSLSPAMIAWGPTTLSDNWALILLWAAMPWTLAWLWDERSSRLFLAGLVVGITFLVRIQMALWAGGLGLCLLFGVTGARSRFKALAFFSLGYLAAIGVQGVLDWITWGSFLHSTITNVQMNFFQNVGATYGVAPWYAYFPLLAENPGGFWVDLFLVLLAAVILSRSLRARGGDLMILVPAVVFFAGHLIIPHKEARFLLPVFPAMVYAMALFAENFLDHALARVMMKPPAGAEAKALLAVLVALPLVAWGAQTRVDRPEHYSYSNMSELMLAIRADGALLRHPESCVLLVDHYWVWSHGEMLQGHPVRWVEKRASELSEHDLDDCVYAVTAGASMPYFQVRAAGRWQEIARNRWSYTLFRKIGS